MSPQTDRLFPVLRCSETRFHTAKALQQALEPRRASRNCSRLVPPKGLSMRGCLLLSNMTDDAPTSAAPATMSTIPSQWWMCSLRFSSTIVSSPANSTSVPRSIWNVDANLRTSANKGTIMIKAQLRA